MGNGEKGLQLGFWILRWALQRWGAEDWGAHSLEVITIIGAQGELPERGL